MNKPTPVVAKSGCTIRLHFDSPEEAEEAFESLETQYASDERDLRGPAVVVRGSVLRGFEFYGPFPTIDAAYSWCRSKTFSGVLGVNTDTIVLLEEPKVDDILV